MSVTNRVRITSHEEFNKLALAINEVLDKVELNEEVPTLSDIRSIRDAAKDYSSNLGYVEEE